MHKRMRNGIAAAVTGTVATGVLATGLAMTTGPVSTQVAAASATPSNVASAVGKAGLDATAPEFLNTKATKIAGAKKVARVNKTEKVKKAQAKHGKAVHRRAGLASGRATATSFWDPTTASGRAMRYETLASPYWPIGTRVRISYKGHSAIGVVDDFGPAEWAVAQHSPPAIIDLSEKMMADFTGSRQNSVTVRFEVLSIGSGPVYRHSGTGYRLAMGR